MSSDFQFWIDFGAEMRRRRSKRKKKFTKTLEQLSGI